MNARGDKEILTEFPKYVLAYKELEREWYQLCSWQYIKQWRNLRARHKLTLAYQKKMVEWEL